MTSIKSVDQISEILHNSNLSWLLANLRQDFLVWNSLTDPDFYDKFRLSIPADSVFSQLDFSPARLALLALGQSNNGSLDPQKLYNSIDQQLIQAAVRSFSDQAILKTYPQDLAGAGMIALAIAHKYHMSNSWTELISTLPYTDYQIWSAPFACLFGYIENPYGLLSALILPGCDPIRFKLAIHALLSNPIHPQDQVDILIGLCTAQHGDLLPPTDRMTLIDELYGQRPQLAVELCVKWLDTHPEYSAELYPKNLNTSRNIEQLAEILFQIKVRQIAGNSNLPVDLVSAERILFHSLSTSLAGQILSHDSTTLSGNGISLGSLDFGEQAVQISKLTLPPNHTPVEQAELALMLFRIGCIEKASELLPQPTGQLPDDVNILYAISCIAFHTGDQQLAVLAASRILELLDHQVSIASVPVWGEYLSQVNLGVLLNNLQKPVEASRVFEFALRTCPDDTRLLKMLAQSYQAAHQDQLACETLHALVSLNPQEVDHRRLFSNSLATIGEWQACLNERAIVLESSQSNGKSAHVNDIYAYAQSAINANHPELALKVSTELLAQDQDDTQALIYAGKAHLQMGSIEQGLDDLIRATMAPNQLEEAWLALSSAQLKIFPRATVIETLKNGAQAIPDSSKIYFTLGDLYLQDNAPTLALPNLRSAMELSPTDPNILVSYGQALKLLGHLDEAREILSKAYGIEPEFPGLAQSLAKILVDSGDIEGAISPLERQINNKTIQDPVAYLDYARCILTLNKRGSAAYPPMKALIALNEVLQIDPELAEAKVLTAEALAAGGENELAFQAYREALDTSLTEDNTWRERISYGFGCIASSIGKHDIAIAALQEASQANPNNTAVYMALSDAYISACLPEDAIRSARSAMVVDGDNPDSLAWFSRQMVKIMWSDLLDMSNSASSLSKQLPSEALTAICKAIQLAPTRTDLSIQLGNLYSSIGEKEEAKAIFTSIATFDFATTADLRDAAQYLTSAGDHLAAIACLEKAVTLDQAGIDQHVPFLYTFLAQEYVNNHDHTSATSILDKAIDLIPEDISLVSLKIDILLELDQRIDALQCIETFILNTDGRKLDNDLLYLASRISRSMGDFTAAIKYSGMITLPTPIKGSNKCLVGIPIRYRTQIAELYRSLLQPHQAYQILQSGSNPSASDYTIEQDYIDYLCLNNELALDTGEPLLPGIEDVQVDASNPSYSRLMAIKSRIMYLTGNSSQAAQLFAIALRSLNNVADPSIHPGWEAPYIKYINTVSVIEAALDVGLWDQAVDLTQQILEASTSVPLPHLILAQAIILKAEFINLCEIFDVLAHKPSLEPPVSESFKLAMQFLDHAQTILESHQGEPIVADCCVTYDQVYRWRARANIIFEKNDASRSNDIEILAHQLTGADSAALILHLHHLSVLDPGSDALTRIIKLARINPRDPAVILQVALALQESNPTDAVRALQSVLQQNPSSKNPTIAFCNILLTRIGLRLEEFSTSQAAIETAIEYWPDEPFWHALAAQVYLRTADVKASADHLSVAAQLDPKNITYLLDLGKLYLDSSHEDLRVLNQALTCFENALELDQNEVSALIYLATTQCLMNDLENANDIARKALFLAPNRVDIYQLLSEIAVRSEDYQGAYEYANKAILINPRDIQSTVGLVKALSALGRHDEALSKLDAAIPAVEQALPLYLERVNILHKKDGPRAALSELISLTRSYPSDFTVLNALSRCYVEVGEPESAVLAALQALNTCAEKTSRNEQANLHLMIGQILRQSGQLDQSIEHLSEAIQLAPDRLEPYLELGLARKERREYQQALQIFERATVIAPDDPRAPYQAGLALKESKDYKSSETMLRKAVSLAPNDLNIRRQLAAVVALNLVHNPRAGRI